jgi:hypothetical protein
MISNLAICSCESKGVFDRKPVRTQSCLLHDSISECTAVVCVMGERSGCFPTAAKAEPFAYILPSGFSDASYTQWEFFFARHHQRRLSIYLARKGSSRIEMKRLPVMI